jgi:hypothetical protein
MLLPTSVFLDTSVLAGQQYNFSSAALSSFIPVAKAASLELLLPDPTEREIRRQIEKRSVDALNALENARRLAPFLSKWEHFPQKKSAISDWAVRRVAFKELGEFLRQFNVKKLGYSDVNVSEVMGWYDNVKPPFREGKKRKEFPDAFAVAILAAYASKTGSRIAVVSEDPDFRLACDRYPSFFYFDALPTLTELLLKPDDQIEELRTSVLDDIGLLDDGISDAASDLEVIHYNSDYKIEGSSIELISIDDVRVVGVGKNECTIVFSAEIEVENHMVWEDWDDSREDYLERDGWVSETATISGCSKVAINKDTKKISEVLLVSLDQDFIEVDEVP